MKVYHVYHHYDIIQVINEDQLSVTSTDYCSQTVISCGITKCVLHKYAYITASQ